MYSLRRQILEGLFDIADLLSGRNFPRELSKNDLQRISSDYAEMVVRHRSLPKLEKTLSTKRMILDKDPRPSEEMTEKKSKVLKIRERESLTKRHSIAHIIADTRSAKTQKINDKSSLK